MEQIPTWVMNPDKWRFPTLITPEQAFKKQMEQWLCGDSVDGYPGIKGFGPKKFEKHVVDVQIMEMMYMWEIRERCLDLYLDNDYTLTQAYQQYLCATIKHHHLPDYAKCLSVEELEADDRLGYYATEEQDEEVRVIVSIDKDMEQIPTWVMNPDKWRFPTLITPEQAFKKQMEQWLCGDSVDGYPGIKGFGPKKFEKHVVDHQIMEMQYMWEIRERCLDMYLDADYTLTQAQQQLLCATIKHHLLPDYAKCITVKDLEALW